MAPKQKGTVILEKPDGEFSENYENYTGNGKLIYIRVVKNKKVTDEYEGEIVLGKKHGLGNCYYHNGDFYLGSFENDRRNGIGTYYYANSHKTQSKLSRSKNKNTSESGNTGESGSGSGSESKSEIDRKIEIEKDNDEVGDDDDDDDDEDEKNGSEQEGSNYFISSDESNLDESDETDDSDGSDESDDSDDSEDSDDSDDSDEKNEDEKADKKVKNGYYYGFFKNGIKHGYGMMQYANGDAYMGEWKMGKKHGTGLYAYEKKKNAIQGLWDEGVLLNGCWYLADGTTLVGNFKDNTPTGTFVWMDGNGEQVHICYKPTEKKESEDDKKL